MPIIWEIGGLEKPQRNLECLGLQVFAIGPKVG